MRCSMEAAYTRKNPRKAAFWIGMLFVDIKVVASDTIL